MDVSGVDDSPLGMRCTCTQVASSVTHSPQLLGSCQELCTLLQLTSSPVPFTGEEDLLDIQSAIVEVAARWKHIGDVFRLSPGTLDAIREDHSKSESRLRETILKWLQKCYDHQLYGPPTWRWVVEAVASPAGGDKPELARKIADQHPNGTF